MNPRRRASTTLDQTIAPQLSAGELRSIYSQELFVFRCDVTAAQISSAMTSYPTLRDVGVLTPDDISNLSRQIHTEYRLSSHEKEVFKHIKQLIADLKSGEIPGHPLASVHLMSCLKDMERFDVANEFWKWLIDQGETHCDARVYGAAIENYTYQGVAQDEMEKMFTEALERYSETVDSKVARDTGKATRLMLLQGIITARILHGDWRGAYEGFDISVRLYPTLTPARIYELFLYERPVKEAYIVFLMACRAGTPPRPATLTPLLKEIWAKHRDVKAMIRLVYAFVGAGGKPFPQHLNSLIFAILGSLPSDASKSKGEEFDKMFGATMALIRDLIYAFGKLQVFPSEGTFNTIISLGGKLRRLDLVLGGIKELLAANLVPNMVTYRTVINAFGELEDREQFKRSWQDLCAAREELKIPWDIKDFIALIKA
ncbi:unnamed protein product [Tuber melanosporum]|uniref:(Perigord truffle) hypothetical protein n=1 Tax=Tuber melanosporum (strain Mel28) TaxID=656061 RepID=D5G3V2_TUBMM|nr:uncharacterized protein GSTUM_00003816001 [Tuber melanosporum]CAZ79195.1 unnamed protein product [Tuber melanosporum]